MMIAGRLFWLVLLLALGVAGAVWLYGAERRRSRDVPMAESDYAALDILEQRYARGEMNREKYLEKKSDMLRPDWGGPAP